MGATRNVRPLTEDQQRIVAEHLGLAKRIAANRRASCLPIEDRIQEACLGLIDAARSFDPSRGARFATYAGYRAVGAIVDAERRVGAVVISIGRAGRERGEPEIKAVSVEAMNMAGAHGRDFIASNAVFIDREPPVSEAVDRRDAIEAALAGLPATDRAIARSYWLDGKTMKRVGEEVGVSESRVCQLTTRALPRLASHSALAEYAEAS